MSATMQNESMIDFIHIPKTGGTAIKQTFREAGMPINMRMNGHGVTLQDVVDSSSKCVFFIRDIATRFVSGFNSRLRKGEPFTSNDWNVSESEAFKQFETPNQLAEALGGQDGVLRHQAEFAMDNIAHTRLSLHHWLQSVSYLEDNKNSILFIGRQECLDSDFQKMLKAIGYRNSITITKDPVRAHKTPDKFEVALSAAAHANIMSWYKEDIEIIKWCDE